MHFLSSPLALLQSFVVGVAEFNLSFRADCERFIEIGNLRVIAVR